MRPRFLVGAVAIAALTLSAEAAAQSPAAEALFREGVALLDSGDLKGACARFAESHKLEPSVGAAMNLGRCLERDGKNASAWASYLAAASQAHARGDQARETEANARASALEPKLRRVRFVTEEPDVTVTVDGVVIPSGDRSLPFDPGEHRIEASAPSRQTWASTFDVKSEPGQGSVTVPRLLAVSAPLVSTTTAGVAAPPPILAYTLFGASAVAAGFSVYYWVTTGAKESSREEAVASSNPSHRATADELRDQGLKAQTFAIVTTSVAAAAALGGVALVLLVRPGAERSAPKSAAFVPYVGLTGGGLRGQF